MIITITVLYVWLTFLFLWFGKHAKSSVIDRPLILSSTIFSLFFQLMALVWIGSTIYLLFKYWQIPVFTYAGITLLKIVLGKIAEYLENIALFPISYIYDRLEKWAERKYGR